MRDRNAHVISSRAEGKDLKLHGVTYVAFVLDEVISKSRQRQGFEITVLVISSHAEGKAEITNRRIQKLHPGRAEGKSVANKLFTAQLLL